MITKEILLLHVKTGDQVADIFTKFLDSEKLKKFMCQMNIEDISSRAENQARNWKDLNT